MSFKPQKSYSKQELIECSNGNLFINEGDGRLPADEMLMFDEISNIDNFGGEFQKGNITAILNINPDYGFLIAISKKTLSCLVA